jgi:hypothetical protein
MSSVNSNNTIPPNKPPSNDNSRANSQSSQPSFSVISADTILKTQYPEPIWIIPNLLPVGLTILAGPPKVGKSWLALQMAMAVAIGGKLFDQAVQKGKVLYLALEDPPRRLQQRMNKMSWPLGSNAEFLNLKSFQTQVHYLNSGGTIQLTNRIKELHYTLVVIDTLSRAIAGDQNDVALMTKALSPLQSIPQDLNCGIILIDHHKKTKNQSSDVIADVLGSTAKGAVVDTVIGLYRERGKPGARLDITGRDLTECTMNLNMNWEIGTWQLISPSETLPEGQLELITLLENEGPLRLIEISKKLKRNRGTIHKQLARLEGMGKVGQKNETWCLVKDIAKQT